MIDLFESQRLSIPEPPEEFNILSHHYNSEETSADDKRRIRNRLESIFYDTFNIEKQHEEYSPFNVESIFHNLSQKYRRIFDHSSLGAHKDRGIIISQPYNIDFDQFRKLSKKRGNTLHNSGQLGVLLSRELPFDSDRNCRIRCI